MLRLGVDLRAVTRYASSMMILGIAIFALVMLLSGYAVYLGFRQMMD